MPWLCFFAFLTGVGSVAAFSGSMKTCKMTSNRYRDPAHDNLAALNWPNHRGTATAFPLSAFGLSAFFFSSLSSLAFPDDTALFLLLLAIGTFLMAFLSSFFLRVIPHSQNYVALPTHEEHERSRSNPLHRTRSGGSKRSIGQTPSEPGRQSTTSQDSSSYHDDATKDPKVSDKASNVLDSDANETSSLMSRSSTSMPGDISTHENGAKPSENHHNSRQLDIRGLSMLPTIEFWQLFLLLGLLTGIGLMTIK